MNIHLLIALSFFIIVCNHVKSVGLKISKECPENNSFLVLTTFPATILASAEMLAVNE
jgi:energy-converting hydrogenase Eha subunit A